MLRPFIARSMDIAGISYPIPGPFNPGPYGGECSHLPGS